LGSDTLHADRIAIASIFMEKLKTRNVFLDVEAFRLGGFNYRSSPFRTLAELAAAGEVHVFTADITVKEVKALIREDIEKAVRTQQSFEQKAYILRNCKSALNRDRLKALDDARWRHLERRRRTGRRPNTRRQLIRRGFWRRAEGDARDTRCGGCLGSNAAALIVVCRLCVITLTGVRSETRF
jgi:hypothetical protein